MAAPSDDDLRAHVCKRQRGLESILLVCAGDENDFVLHYSSFIPAVNSGITNINGMIMICTNVMGKITNASTAEARS